MYLYEVGTQSSVLINLMSEVTFKKGSSVEAFFHEGDLTFCINNIFWLLSQYFLQTVKTSKAAVAHSTSLTQVHFGPQRKQDKTKVQSLQPILLVV